MLTQELIVEMQEAGATDIIYRVDEEILTYRIDGEEKSVKAPMSKIAEVIHIVCNQ